jgi:hypothetical protein
VYRSGAYKKKLPPGHGVGALATESPKLTLSIGCPWEFVQKLPMSTPFLVILADVRFVT